MKKVKILLKQHSYSYANNEYDFYSLSDIINFYNSKMKIIILEEPLFIRLFQINKEVKKIADFIEEKIKNVFPQNGDILYDYEVEKQEKLLAIYSIKGKKKIEKIILDAKEVKIIPIQFFMREVIVKRMKNKKLTCSVIFQINKSYYFIYIKNGLITDNYIGCNIDEIINKIETQGLEKQVYIDDSISINTHASDTKFIKINMKDYINEKLY